MIGNLRRSARHGLTYGLLALGASACSENAPTDVVFTGRNLDVTAGATLLQCPTNVTRSVEGTFGLVGGTLQLDGHSITLPYGAVALPTTLTLTVPASNYVEIDITANDLEHFEFAKAVDIVISYERCTRSNLQNRTVTAWYFDGSTKALIEQMNSTDDRANMRVSFPTDHLSEYSAATN